jgi:hypothetical protein
MAAWCESWKIKTSLRQDSSDLLTHQNRPPNSLLTLNERNIPFVNSVKHLGAISVKRGHGDFT